MISSYILGQRLSFLRLMDKFNISRLSCSRLFSLGHVHFIPEYKLWSHSILRQSRLPETTNKYKYIYKNIISCKPKQCICDLKGMYCRWCEAHPELSNLVHYPFKSILFHNAVTCCIRMLLSWQNTEAGCQLKSHFWLSSSSSGKCDPEPFLNIYVCCSLRPAMLIVNAYRLFALHAGRNKAAFIHSIFFLLSSFFKIHT
jgi:hypothetical protein